MAKILETRRLTPVTKLFLLEAPMIAASAQPGQFVMVRVREGGERIPITIANYDRETGTLVIVVQEAGATTKRLCALEAGQEILDVAGPLGSPVEIPEKGHICGVGGGFGAAALLCLMRECTRRGHQTTALLGARTKGLLILVDELEPICTKVEVCTDDGSVGFKGFVSLRLKQLVAGEGPGRPDLVVAIGPMAMMRSVAEATRTAGVKTLVSMDPLMVDGTGMCGGCRVTVANQPKFACVDGPCFDGHKVDFDEAMRRNKMYVREEKLALERVACTAGKER